MKPSQQPATGTFVERICRAFPSFPRAHRGYKVIDIREAVEQFLISWDSGAGDFDHSIFASGVIPPFPGCIFEYRGGDNKGFLLKEDGGNPVLHDMATCFHTLALDENSRLRLIEEFPETAQSAFWEVRALGYVAVGEDICFNPSLTLYLNKDGSPVLDKKDLLVSVTGEDIEDRDVDVTLLAHILPVLFAITLMHCRNVSLESVTIPLPLAMKKSKRRKQIEERKKYPAFDRHIVVIRDRKGRVISTTLQRQQPGSKRMHWVRGHFSTYTEVAPLFGRIVGRFWIPAHLSGLASVGVIDSLYRLEA